MGFIDWLSGDPSLLVIILNFIAMNFENFMLFKKGEKIVTFKMNVPSLLLFFAAHCNLCGAVTDELSTY